MRIPDQACLIAATAENVAVAGQTGVADAAPAADAAAVAAPNADAAGSYSAELARYSKLGAFLGLQHRFQVA